MQQKTGVRRRGFSLLLAFFMWALPVAATLPVRAEAIPEPPSTVTEKVVQKTLELCGRDSYGTVSAVVRDADGSRSVRLTEPVGSGAAQQVSFLTPYVERPDGTLVNALDAAVLTEPEMTTRGMSWSDPYTLQNVRLVTECQALFQRSVSVLGEVFVGQYGVRARVVSQQSGVSVTSVKATVETDDDTYEAPEVLSSTNREFWRIGSGYHIETTVSRYYPGTGAYYSQYSPAMPPDRLVWRSSPGYGVHGWLSFKVFYTLNGSSYQLTQGWDPYAS